jgi:hypothetical protein
MSNPDVSIGFEATGDVDVVYGECRRAVAEWAGIDPADVTGDHVARYEAAQEEGARP